MQTLTMQGIAELAQVKRPVVTVWRKRHASSIDSPFPAPLSADPLCFDAAEVAEWLASTGHGNNHEPKAESPMHSSASKAIAQDADRASVLFLLHHLLGGPVTDVTADRASRLLDARRLGPIVSSEALRSALGDPVLRAAVDELAEAAFSGARGLDRLVDGFTSVDAPWAGEALTAAATDLLGSVLAELHRASPRVVVPAGPGGLLLADTLARRLDEHERPAFAARPDRVACDADRAAWRRLAAQDFPVVPFDADPDPTADTKGRLHLLMWQGPPRPRELADLIAESVVELGADDLLVVVGPARLLTDSDGRGDRTRLLHPSADHVERLRYVAQLPKGLSRFGGRRRLALWVLGGAESAWTVVGAHADAQLDSAARSAIAADVAASASGPADVRAHAFRSSAVRGTRQLVRQTQLTAAPAPAAPTLPGPERLARVWGLRDALTENVLADVDLEAGLAPRPLLVSLEDAAPAFARDLPGTRLATALVGPPAPGQAHVIGPEEVRDAASVGRRGIDRLALERAAPRAHVTEPGDVVYVAAGGPAAMVDEHGGHVVLAPARILRCHAGRPGRRRLLASVVARDISAQSGTDRRAWQLRTVSAEDAEPLSMLAKRTAERRHRLLQELRTLDDLERELVHGLADGSLTAMVPRTPPPTPKAAR